MTLNRLTASLAAAGFVASALVAAPVHADPTQVRYRTQAIDNIEIFYREAGSPDAPAALLLHGFPTSSHMFRDLIPRLAQRYHVVAPDHPGYGFSSPPSPAAFSYTFDHLADIMSRFTQAIGLERYALYMQDFGGPVGFHMAVQHSERISALIVQNANAYEEGLSPAMDAARPA